MNKICEQVRDLLAHDRGNLNFSPAARYAVSKLCDYAEQEHEQREKAETILCGERRKALVMCGVLKDDGWQYIQAFTSRFALDKEKPRITVRITDECGKGEDYGLET